MGFVYVKSPFTKIPKKVMGVVMMMLSSVKTKIKEMDIVCCSWINTDILSL